MATYSVRFTDINVNSIIIDQGTVNTSAVDIALFGRIDLEYGQLLNANLLHLLENFSCPENANNPGNPDLNVATVDALSNPVDGQLWFNSTQGVPFMWIGTSWEAIGTSADFAANSGRIIHGQQLPLPISSSGYQFTYNECIWAVSPSGSNAGFSYMVCTTNDNGLVNHQYAAIGSNVLSPGVANYIIIGIRGTNNRVSPYNYNNNPPPPPPLVNLTPTPSITPTPTPAALASPTPSATRTFTPSPTQSPPPSLTPTPTIFPTPTITPTPTTIPPVSALVYINPSVGYSSRFGGSTSLQACSFNANGTGTICKTPLSIVLADLTGGAGGPYTIGMNINWFFSAYNNDTNQGNAAAPTGYSPTSGVTFSGNSNGYNVYMNSIVTNVSGGSGINLVLAYLQPNFTLPVGDNLGTTVTISIGAGSNIVIADNTGCNNIVNIACANHVIRYYIPGGSSGQVPASQLTSPPSTSYVDTYNITSFTLNTGGCVTTDTIIPGFGLASDITVGDTLTIVDPVTLNEYPGTVSYAQKSMAECVRVETHAGIELECSTSAPIAVEGGAQVYAPELLGKRIPVSINGEWAIDTVVSITPIGVREIMHITCENAFFAAGKKNGYYLLHHNKIIP